jgi:hypothetical protein
MRGDWKERDGQLLILIGSDRCRESDASDSHLDLPDSLSDQAIHRAADHAIGESESPALALTDAASKYVPALSTDPNITITSLLNMSAGLVDYTTLPEAPSWLNGVRHPQ